MRRNRTRISDTLATPSPSPTVFKAGTTNQGILFPDNRSCIPPEYRNSFPASTQNEYCNFYANYDAYEGSVTAVVLGGFFAFVSLLVIYKTKIKPMWKNRRRRLTNTPATTSVAEHSATPAAIGGDAMESLNQEGVTINCAACSLPLDGNEHECEVEDDDGEPVHDKDCDGNCEYCNEQADEDEFGGFECIPLQTVNCNEEDDDDIYFLDEFGNYVFPISPPTSVVGGGASGNVFTGTSTNCSCQPSAEELDKDLSRRVSQVHN